MIGSEVRRIVCFGIVLSTMDNGNPQRRKVAKSDENCFGKKRLDSLLPATGVREGVDVLFPGTKEIQKVHS